MIGWGFAKIEYKYRYFYLKILRIHRSTTTVSTILPAFALNFDLQATVLILDLSRQIMITCARRFKSQATRMLGFCSLI